LHNDRALNWLPVIYSNCMKSSPGLGSHWLDDRLILLLMAFIISPGGSQDRQNLGNFTIPAFNLFFPSFLTEFFTNKHFSFIILCTLAWNENWHFGISSVQNQISWITFLFHNANNT
jgi:hypothetical protein